MRCDETFSGSLDSMTTRQNGGGELDVSFISQRLTFNLRNRNFVALKSGEFVSGWESCEDNCDRLNGTFVRPQFASLVFENNPMKKFFTFCLCFAPIFLPASFNEGVVSADTIYLIDYDSPSVNPNYDQSDNTGQMNNTVFETPGVGSGGTAGAEIVFSDPGQNGASFSPAYFSNLSNSLVNAATSDNPADYIFSFDYQAFGLTAAGISGQAQLNINGNQIQQSFTWTNTYQTFSTSLSSLTSLTAADFSTGTQQARVNMLGVNGEFGGASAPDAGFRVDNIRIEQIVNVPEPSSAIALITLATCGLIRRKRR